MSDQIINRVASSPLVSLDLEDLYHTGERVVYDIRQNLYQDTILKEQAFRSFIKENDWTPYQGKNVAIQCSAEAIVPTWAYMILASKITAYANAVIFGSTELLETTLFERAIAGLEIKKYKNKKVVIKGCGKVEVPVAAFVTLVEKLRPIASSIMYGEPCSTVPIYKRK